MLVKFSVYFWTFLFAVASWLDNYLLAAWGGVVGGDLSKSIVLFTDGGEMNMAVSALNFITRWLHILLPVMFTSLMGAVGIQGAGLAKTAIADGSTSAGSSAAAVPGIGKNAVGAVGKGAKAVRGAFKK